MADVRRVEEGFGNTPLVDKEMHDEKNENDHEKEEKVEEVREQPVEEKGVEEPLVKQKTKRVATLDVFRGLAIVVHSA